MSTPEPPPYPGGDNQEQPAINPPGFPPPPPPPAPPSYGLPVPGAVPGQGKATTSLVTGIVGIFCCGIVLGIVAIVTGKQATSEAAAAGHPQPGNAKAGIILGWIGLALHSIVAILYLILFAVGLAGGFDTTTY